MTKPVHEQLLEAFEESELTLEQLLEKAELEMDITSLSRKLHGKQILTTKEAERLSQAMKRGFEYRPKMRGVAAL